MKLLDTTAPYTYHRAENTYICTKSPAVSDLISRLIVAYLQQYYLPEKKSLKQIDLRLILLAVFHVSTGQTSQ